MTVDLGDERWTDDQWFRLLESLRSRGLLTWKEITALTLGHLNPSQVGTSLASSDGFKRRYGKGKTMRVVMEWFYSQSGKCKDCGARLELQADHNTPRESFDDPLDADFIENMILRCRRCNVIKRPSHQFGGHTHLTAEAALMWLLLVFHPRTLVDFIRLCRLYGMTMADIRMHEGWAMAHWLGAAGEYEVDDASCACEILLWNEDVAVTRRWKNDQVSGEFSVIYESVAPTDHLILVVADASDTGESAITAFRYPVSYLPFSHYFEGHDLLAQTLAVTYSAPDRKTANGSGPRISRLPPRGMTLIGHDITGPGDTVVVSLQAAGSRFEKSLGPTSKRAKLASLGSAALAAATATITK